MDAIADMAGGKRSKWMAHVKKTMKAHKGKSLKQVLKLAGKTYKKTGGAGEVMPGFARQAGFTKGGASLSPADYSGAAAAPTEGGRRRRGTRKTRKGGRKH